MLYNAFCFQLNACSIRQTRIIGHGAAVRCPQFMPVQLQSWIEMKAQRAFVCLKTHTEIKHQALAA